MSVEKKIKAKSGYGMLAIVAVLLVVIVGLFIWSVAGMAARPTVWTLRSLLFGAWEQASLRFACGSSVERFLLAAARPGARIHPLWQIRGHRSR